MKEEKIKKEVKEFLPYVIIIIVVVLVRAFIVTPAMVDGNSMEPTLNNNNVVILNKLSYRMNELKRFDIVVIKLSDEKIIKRVIGLPGEHVEYKDGGLYVNGFLIEENFKHAETHDFKLENIGYLTIPGDKYFVVGDNRIDSMDSRYIGLIDKKNILGSVSHRIYPFNKISKIK